MSTTHTESLEMLQQHKTMLRFADVIFGSYNMLMIILSAYTWISGKASFLPFVGLTFFMVINIIFSEFSKRSTNPFRIEVLRSILGPFFMRICFFTTQEVFGGWWTGFLIMCLGGNIIHTLFTQRPSSGRLLVFIYTVVLIICIMVIRHMSDWFMISVYLGAVAISGLVFSEILVQLSKSLLNERSAKISVQEQKAYLEEQRTIIEKKSAELEQTYLHITDSIRYAKRIQTALIPLEEKVKVDLPELFIFNRPKDIVSGDFYWYAKKEGYLFLVVADCTGHGVPGAIMTVIGNNLLTSVINEGRLLQPSQILKEIDQRLMQTIQRHEIDDQEFSDGMDVAMVRIDKKNNELVFAGAKRSMLIVKNRELTEVKGNRQSIGRSSDYEKNFEQQVMQIQKGDSFYLFSDGYTDQFGGKDNKKFLISRFKELIVEISEKEMYEQHFLLDRKLKLWKGNTTQTDDILVTGVRL